MNILLVTLDSSIQRQVNQQQTKGRAQMVNLWKDITIMLSHYNDSFTINTSFKVFFSSIMYRASMTSNMIGQNV